MNTQADVPMVYQRITEDQLEDLSGMVLVRLLEFIAEKLEALIWNNPSLLRDEESAQFEMLLENRETLRTAIQKRMTH